VAHLDLKQVHRIWDSGSQNSVGREKISFNQGSFYSELRCTRECLIAGEDMELLALITIAFRHRPSVVRLEGRMVRR
jgi:hypothetical protein